MYIITSLLRRLLIVLCLSLPHTLHAAVIESGQPAPNFSLPLLSGEQSVSLQQMRGKVVYVDFWASWCGPCRISFPLLDDIRQTYKDKGFEVLAINLDEFQDDALQFLLELPVSYPTLYDEAGNTPDSYGILGMPTGFLIDRSGTVRKVHQGFRKSDGEKLRAEIVELLAE